ncbi:MAG TPA: 1-deoxy-D-xylulose-5-phosphate synthase [Dehalococcoidia bacterium]|nr:1-deoxy-D-xylulose-5-phosphate synthase [Dehalococcoidia bacterium]
MYSFLDNINGPADLKTMKSSDLKQLAAEMRDFLFSTVKNTGGHLASNLGMVELTIALHRVFDSPGDKLVWDVGHQSYVHKLLTGRKEMFNTLRQYGGISGFPDPCESDHDQFCTGHASTSISAALGMALARDIKGEQHNVVAIIGDGALTGGMAYEALNHAGNLGKKLIIVLADNGMSISPTVGAMARQLNKFRLDYRVRQTKRHTMKILASTRLGKSIDWLIHRLTRSAKALIMPTMLFEEWGFTYIGPIDGHNISEIETALRQAKSLVNQPAIVHVMLTKGKGYEQSECEPVLYHSLPPGNGSKRAAVSYSRVFSQTLAGLMRKNDRIVVITAAMVEGNCLENIAAEFPQRFFDVGICEEHAVTMAAGLASQRMIPVVAIYSTFLQRGFDQLLHDVCLQDLPVIFAMDRSGIVGEDGKTHQGIFDLSYLKLMPGMIMSAPRDENELQHLLNTAVLAGHPMAIRYPRGEGMGVEMDTELQFLPPGKGELMQDGDDILLLAIGSTVYPALQAAHILGQRGISAAVINARFAKPLDAELIKEYALKTGRVLTLEENTVIGGFGSAVLEMLNEENISSVKVKIIGIPDVFVEHGSLDLLRGKYGLDADGIVQSVLSDFTELDELQAHRLRNS